MIIPLLSPVMSLIAPNSNSCQSTNPSYRCFKISSLHVIMYAMEKPTSEHYKVANLASCY